MSGYGDSATRQNGFQTQLRWTHSLDSDNSVWRMWRACGNGFWKKSRGCANSFWK